MRATPRTAVCEHLPEATVDARADRCESCGSAVNLRACVTCGHVGCCESQQAHNTAHSRESEHAVIRSMPVSPSSFTWCYVCNRYL